MTAAAVESGRGGEGEGGEAEGGGEGGRGAGKAPRPLPAGKCSTPPALLEALPPSLLLLLPAGERRCRPQAAARTIHTRFLAGLTVSTGVVAAVAAAVATVVVASAADAAAADPSAEVAVHSSKACSLDTSKLRTRVCSLRPSVTDDPKGSRTTGPSALSSGSSCISTAMPSKSGRGRSLYAEPLTLTLTPTPTATAPTAPTSPRVRVQRVLCLLPTPPVARGPPGRAL